MCVFVNLLILSFLLNSVRVGGNLSEIENASRRLDELLIGVGAQRSSGVFDEEINTWQEYEFGTGVGNRDGKFRQHFRLNPKIKIDARYYYYFY